jgi:hypothetical protein
MTRQELADAASHLETASESADGDAHDRLVELADQLTTLADRDSDPDHGRLARIQNALGEVQSDVDDDTAATIDDADDAINAFRETLEGV